MSLQLTPLNGCEAGLGTRDAAVQSGALRRVPFPWPVGLADDDENSSSQSCPPKFLGKLEVVRC